MEGTSYLKQSPGQEPHTIKDEADITALEQAQLSPEQQTQAAQAAKQKAEKEGEAAAGILADKQKENQKLQQEQKELPEHKGITAI